ncbi:MAG: hypothetical protein WCO16_03395 [bacterium]
MTTIRFIPIFEDAEFIEATKEYEAIWEKEANRIIEVFNKVTGLSLLENRIACVVYEGMSMSGGTVNDLMKLRASYNSDEKKGTLVHELSHRLVLNIKNHPEDLNSHQVIYLFLYDTWIELYGEEFAKKMLEIEKRRTDMYKKAWEWAMSFSKQQRKQKFADILSK